jgi:hypothetical protein
MIVSERHPIKFRGLNEVVGKFPAKALKDIHIVESYPLEMHQERSRAFNVLTPTRVLTEPKSNSLKDFRSTYAGLIQMPQDYKELRNTPELRRL